MTSTATATMVMLRGTAHLLFLCSLSNGQIGSSNNQDLDSDGSTNHPLSQCSDYMTSSTTTPGQTSITEQCLYDAPVGTDPDTGMFMNGGCDDGCAINTFWKYTPYITSGTEQLTPQDCQAECTRADVCSFWTLDPEGICHFSNFDAIQTNVITDLGYHSGKKCAETPFLQCTKVCMSNMDIQVIRDGNGVPLSISMLSTAAQEDIRNINGCSCFNGSSSQIRSSPSGGIGDVDARIQLPIAGQLDQSGAPENILWTATLSRFSSQFRLEIVPGELNSIYNTCVFKYSWVRGCGNRNCNPTDCSVIRMDPGNECNSPDALDGRGSLEVCSFGERLDVNCIQQLPQCGGNTCPDISAHVCTTSECDGTNNNENETRCPFSNEWARENNVPPICDDPQSPCENIDIEDGAISLECCNKVERYCALSAIADSSDAGCSSEIYFTVAGLCNIYYNETADGESALVAGLPDPCTCGSCEQIDYDICDCLTVAHPRRSQIDTAGCSALQDIDGDYVCGFDSNSGRCVGCNMFRSSNSCRAAGPSCAWDVRSTSCTVAYADTSKFPTHDALGNECPSQSATQPTCQCRDRSFLSSEELQNSPTLFAAFVRSSFQITTCGAVGVASCPDGVGTIKMLCDENGDWDPSTWDPSACSSNTLTESIETRTRSFLGLEVQLNRIAEVANTFWNLGDADIVNLRLWLVAATNIVNETMATRPITAQRMVPFTEKLSCVVSNVLRRLEYLSNGESDSESAGFRTTGHVTIASTMSLDLAEVTEAILDILSVNIPSVTWYVQAYRAPSGVCVAPVQSTPLVPTGMLGYYVKIEGQSNYLSDVLGPEINNIGTLFAYDLQLRLRTGGTLLVTSQQFFSQVFRTGPISRTLENILSLLASYIPEGESLGIKTPRLRVLASSLNCSTLGRRTSESLMLSVTDKSIDRANAAATFIPSESQEEDSACPSLSAEVIDVLELMGYSPGALPSRSPLGVQPSPPPPWTESVSIPIQAMVDAKCLSNNSGSFGVVLTTYDAETFFEGSGNESNPSLVYMNPDGEIYNNGSVVSRISSVSFGSTLDWRTAPPLTSDLILNFIIDDTSGPHTCVFYEYDEVQWRSDGGRVASVVNGTINCAFNHTTNFAVLTGVGGHNGASINAGHKSALSVIMYIGVAFTVVCCIATVATHAIFRNLRTTAKWILVNLFITLAIGELLFVAGVVLAVEDDVAESTCQGIGIATHYVLLVAFGWMLMDGLFVHFLFTNVYAAHRRDEKLLFRKYIAFAYGIPVIIVGVTVGLLGTDPYGSTGQHCFLTAKDGAIWAFTGPMVLVLLLNAVMLVRIVSVVYSATVRRKSSLSERDQERHESRIKAKRALHASVSFFWLMGLGWGFGLFAIGDLTVTFQYIFSIMLALQGLCLFIFNCALDESVRKSWSSLSSWSRSRRSGRKNSADGVVMRRKRSKEIDGSSSSGGFGVVNTGIAAGELRFYNNELYKGKQGGHANDDGYIHLPDTSSGGSAATARKTSSVPIHSNPTNFGTESGSINQSIRSLPAGSASSGSFPSGSQRELHDSVPDSDIEMESFPTRPRGGSAGEGVWEAGSQFS